MLVKIIFKLIYLWFLLDFNFEDYFRESVIKIFNEEFYEFLLVYFGRRKKGKREFEINCISKKLFFMIFIVIFVCLDILFLFLKIF